MHSLTTLVIDLSIRNQEKNEVRSSFPEFVFFSHLLGSLAAIAQNSVDVGISSDSILISSGQLPTDSVAAPRAFVEASIRKNMEFTISLNRINAALHKELDTVETMKSLPLF